MSYKYLRIVRVSVAAAGLTVLSGCADIQYLYDIPSDQDECPVDTIHRSGGTSIRDRSGGTNIRDRDGDNVDTYCELQVCPDGTTMPTGDPIMVWHLDDHGVVLARGTCPAD